MKTIEEMKTTVNDSLDIIMKHMEECVDDFKKECANESGDSFNSSFGIVLKAKIMIETFEQLQRDYETKLSQLEMLEMLEDK